MAARKAPRKVGPNSSAGTVRVKGQPKLPTHDKAHARNALARINQTVGLSPAQKRTVVSAAYRRLGTPPSERKVKVSAAGRITKTK